MNFPKNLRTGREGTASLFNLTQTCNTVSGGGEGGMSKGGGGEREKRRKREEEKGRWRWRRKGKGFSYHYFFFFSFFQLITEGEERYSVTYDTGSPF